MVTERTLCDFGPVTLLLWVSIPQLLNGIDNATGTIGLGPSTEALQTFSPRSFSVAGLGGELSSIPGPHPFDARSAPSVTTTDVPRCHPHVSRGKICL